MDPKLKPGTRFCKCTVCGEYFTGDKAFASHRTGEYPNRVCIPAGSLSGAGFYRVVRGKHEYWAGRRKKGYV